MRWAAPGAHGAPRHPVSAVRGPNPVSYLNRASVYNLQAVASCFNTEYKTHIFKIIYRSSVEFAHFIDRFTCND